MRNLSSDQIHNRSVIYEENGVSIDEDIKKHYPTRQDNVFQILKIASQICSTRVPLLITGESGIGKETLAKAIHIAGNREKGRFIVASCSNLPANFFDMDIFKADFCTLMLDEITELSPTLQLKLLRVLKEQELGAANCRGTALCTRIIACTNKNLANEVNAQKFRNDLFFKLQVAHLKLPPLRDRPLDIDFYSEIFLNEFNVQFSKNTKLSQSAKQLLRTYTWPGNIRELHHVLQKCVLFSRSEYIGSEDLHMVRTNSRTETALGEPLPQVTISELEQRLILQTLRRMNGNRTHTAKALGISLRALRYKLNELVDCGYEVEGKNK